MTAKDPQNDSPSSPTDEHFCDSIAEAVRREEEWKKDPSVGITLEQLASSVGRDVTDSVTEAISRKAEMDADPSIGITWDEIKSNLGRN